MEKDRLIPKLRSELEGGGGGGEEDVLVTFVIKSSFCLLCSLYNPTYVFALSIKATERITVCTRVKHFAFLAITNLNKIRSVSRALDCRVGGHGFDSQGQTITRGLK